MDVKEMSLKKRNLTTRVVKLLFILSSLIVFINTSSVAASRVWIYNDLNWYVKVGDTMSYNFTIYNWDFDGDGNTSQDQFPGYTLKAGIEFTTEVVYLGTPYANLRHYYPEYTTPSEIHPVHSLEDPFSDGFWFTYIHYLTQTVDNATFWTEWCVSQDHYTFENGLIQYSFNSTLTESPGSTGLVEFTIDYQTGWVVSQYQQISNATGIVSEWASVNTTTPIQHIMSTTTTTSTTTSTTSTVTKTSTTTSESTSSIGFIACLLVLGLVSARVKNNRK